MNATREEVVQWLIKHPRAWEGYPEKVSEDQIFRAMQDANLFGAGAHYVDANIWKRIQDAKARMAA